MTFPEFVYGCFLVICLVIVTGDLLVKCLKIIELIFKPLLETIFGSKKR